MPQVDLDALRVKVGHGLPLVAFKLYILRRLALLAVCLSRMAPEQPKFVARSFL